MGCENSSLVETVPYDPHTMPEEPGLNPTPPQPAPTHDKENERSALPRRSSKKNSQPLNELKKKAKSECEVPMADTTNIPKDTADSNDHKPLVPKR